MCSPVQSSGFVCSISPHFMSMDRKGVALKAFAVSALTALSCLGVCATPPGFDEWCYDIPGLNPAQVELCNSATGLQTAIHTGLLQAVETCEEVFKDQRWNCSMMGSSSLLVRGPEGTAEEAFASALTAAGLALHISTACEQGSSPNCFCDVSNRSFCRRASKVFGSRLALRFLAANSSFSTVDRHNARVGLKALRQSAHGKSYTPLEKVAKILRRKYLNSHRVVIAASAKRAKRGDLVYLNQSPDYCVRDKHVGIAGTRGRACDARGDGCKTLCCGRGYSTHQYNTTTPCQVRFVVSNGFLVMVQADQCSKSVLKSRCN